MLKFWPETLTNMFSNSPAIDVFVFKEVGFEKMLYLATVKTCMYFTTIYHLPRHCLLNNVLYVCNCMYILLKLCLQW